VKESQPEQRDLPCVAPEAPAKPKANPKAKAAAKTTANKGPTASSRRGKPFPPTTDRQEPEGDAAGHAAGPPAPPPQANQDDQHISTLPGFMAFRAPVTIWARGSRYGVAGWRPSGNICPRH